MLKSIKAPTKKALIEEQEYIICKYIDKLDKINICSCQQMIVKVINYLFCFENQTFSY